MKYSIFPLLLFLAQLLPAQEKGVTPASTSNFQLHPEASGSNSTRAVVVGISDYQSPAITDLKYADRDARAFADWLKSPAGGSVPEENIQLLLNDQAKNADFGAALDGLAEDSREGDLAIIYFSGHGDVETKTRNQFGFLLAWDSPPTNYKAGAYALIFLQDIISTIADKKARVLVIADACHAGKLAGSADGGTQATAQYLAQQFAGEIKILSCQPNEFALEGKEWGGGRGAFSFNLIEALTGLADKNGDAKVNLYEVDRYLGDVVPAQTAPHSQIPMVIGDKQAVVAYVDAAALDSLRASKSGLMASIDTTEEKGLGDADSSARQLYEAFTIALKQGRLLEPAGQNANDLYERLLGEPALQALHGLMRRNLAAALQNDPQQALNALLESDPNEVTAWRADPARYADYPRYLSRALELLGEGHYMYNTLLSKKQYFEAYLHLRNIADVATNPEQREAERNSARTLLREAIELEPYAAYLYHALASSFFNTNPVRTDSVAVYCQKAMEYAPQWLMPYLDLFYEYHVAQNNYLDGEKWLLLAVERNPESYIVLERLAWLRQWQNRTGEALDICRRMIALKPDLFSGYGTMGTTYWMRGEYAQAVELLEQAAQLTTEKWLWPTFALAYFRKRDFPRGFSTVQNVLNNPQSDADTRTATLAALLAGLYEHRRYDLALPYFGWADSLYGYAFFHVICNLNEAKILYALGRTAAAEQRLRDVFALDNADNSYFALAEAWLGQLAAGAGKIAEAEAYFQKAMTARGYSALDQAEPMEEACTLYGHFLLKQNRLEEAELRFRQALEWRHWNSCKGWYGLACLYAQKRDTERSLDCLEKALDNWFPIPEPIYEEPLFKKIRKTKRFKAMIAKYFPDLKASF